MYPNNKTLILLITCLFLFSYPSLPHAYDTMSNNGSGVSYTKDESLLTTVKIWWYKYKPGRDNELKELKIKLKMNEEILAQVEATMENIVSSAPNCPNGQMSVSFENDPTAELRKEIEEIKSKIALLEK